MLTAGLVSVTFRNLTKPEICALMEACGLTAIEWGGDIHVPSGSPQDIADACELSARHGICTVAYGSYYKPWTESEESRAAIRRDIGCARALGASTIRVWAGQKGSADITAAERADVVKELQDACDAAKNSGLTVSLECHNGTLTDDWVSALQLLEETDRENLKLYWQPNQFRDTAYNLEALRRELPYITNVHVFSWEGKDHFPLEKHEGIWRQYLDILATSGRDHNLLLEFMYNNEPDQLHVDAAVLKRWLA
ncbi:MAG: TIM barrel protein [Clostridia bacterium]|nr:TIM barrel protein [Clostridia bacterium]